MDQQRIIDLIRKGNRKAMHELYSLSVAYLTGVCQRYISNQEDVKDVMQESYISIFQNISGYRPTDDATLRSWMSRIVVNKSIDHLRRQHLHWEEMEDIPDIPDEPLDASLVSIETLHRLIRQLPPGYRTVLNLYIFEGKSHAEIAQILQIKEGTSASQYHRAKAMLKEMMLNHKNDKP